MFRYRSRQRALRSSIVPHRNLIPRLLSPIFSAKRDVSDFMFMVNSRVMGHMGMKLNGRPRRVGVLSLSLGLQLSKQDPLDHCREGKTSPEHSCGVAGLTRPAIDTSILASCQMGLTCLCALKSPFFPAVSYLPPLPPPLPRERQMSQVCN